MYDQEKGRSRDCFARNRRRRPPQLNHARLAVAQRETLATPRRGYGIMARILFATFDILYGKERTFSKFKVLELVARVPYQSWEQVAYIAISHVHNRIELAHRIVERVRESREQQDNEQWHLLILEDLISRSGKEENQPRSSRTRGRRRACRATRSRHRPAPSRRWGGPPRDTM